MLRRIFSVFQRLFVNQKVSKDVLVIQPFPGIGDVIWFLPHMHALADSKGCITLMTKPRSFADKLLSADNQIKTVLWLERNPGRHDGVRGFFRLVKDIRQRAYKEAWLFHSSSRYAWALYIAGVPKTYGYGKKFQKYLLTEPCFLSKQTLLKHPIQKSNRLLENAGIPFDNKEPDYFVSESVLKQVKTQYVLTDDSSAHAVFAIGGSGAYKQWGRDNFLDLANGLYELGIEKIFLVGGTAEEEMADWMISNNRTKGVQLVKVINLAFAQIAALIKCAQLCVGNDTGILHLAAAVKVPSFGLFGATAPLTNSSYMLPVTANAGNNLGMKAISVEMVLERIKQSTA